MSKTLLSIRDLRTYFYTSSGVVKAVDCINLDIHESEALALVGESGSGKTVTAFSIMRFVPKPGRIVGGKIIFKGEDLVKKSESAMRKIRGSRIAMSFQDPMTYLNPVFRVGKQIEESIKLHQEGKKSWERAVKTMELVQIPSAPERAYNYPHQLSGGMRQRSLLAIALSCNPNLLIADEPTTALDVVTQGEVMDLLKEIKKELDISILFITHDLGIVLELADKVAIMYAGNIFEYSDVEKIFNDAKHPYTRGLIDSIPKVGQARLTVIEGNVPNLINSPSGCRFHPRCPYAKEVCAKQRPRMIEVERGHFVACHLYS